KFRSNIRRYRGTVTLNNYTFVCPHENELLSENALYFNEETRALPGVHPPAGSAPVLAASRGLRVAGRQTLRLPLGWSRLSLRLACLSPQSRDISLTSPRPLRRSGFAARCCVIERGWQTLG